MKKKSLIITGILVLIAAAAAWFLFGKSGNQQVIRYETAPVQIGTIANTVTATGTVEPVKQVEVGTQVSGVIKNIYVDFNSQVKKGQLLAELDKTPLLAALASTKAELASANSQLVYQQANFNRIKSLFDKKAVSETDYETALYQYSSAKASVDKMKYEVERAQTNLGYAMIYSPIDGVVLNRAVDEGQTVAASFNTPTLFTIAQDLTKMQVVANVDEADIGQVAEGQKVSFTVDAFPSDLFEGKITQVRLEPTTNSNVVTYSVVVDAPNPDLKLKPGLTASITVTVKEAADVLTVPAKALRFQPDSSLLANNSVKTVVNQASAANLPANNPSQAEKQKDMPSAVNEDETPGTIWVKSGGSIHPVQVVSGISDETNVEIKSGLKEGDLVVVSMVKSSAPAGKDTTEQSSSPFMPKRPGSERKK
ncbi:MAG TPA: efflux RND transporter periplasmic adaptor subunit [Bacteroidales bacterium]|nr:efflux RND transporter periplasmic adaptor subunit [Bacteroidales bacterium]HPT02313.1 efflux RND transporter periplasmic adaptor subunit [Bacteroidales bacterium]